MVTQDLPPPSGFGSIKVERVLPKPIIRQAVLLVAGMVITFNGFSYAGEWRKRYRVLKMEFVEHYIASAPFILAEQERKYLLQLHKIREEERELMKDVPGWKVGTLFGEPVYKTLPKNGIAPVSPMEFAPGLSLNEWINKYVFPDFYD